MNPTQQQIIKLEERIQSVLSKLNIGPIEDKMKSYIIGELGSQAVERALYDIVKNVGEEKFEAFMDFIKKGASKNSLYIYLSAIYPDADGVLQKKLEEVLSEFESDFK
jgi:hypothetical protein